MKAAARFSNDIVIIDELETCPYLPNETARMPLQMPVSKISLAEADLRLANGFRRTGEFVYKTKCPDCNACQGVRIDCQDFCFSRNQKRILSRNDRLFRMEIESLVADGQRVALFNKHRRFRGLAKRDNDIDMEEYIWGFVRSCFESFEMSYWSEDRLVGLAICDQARDSISAVYTFYDPDFGHESVGTYAILKQIELCQAKQLQYLYLGYFIQQSPRMRYKARFMPQDRLIEGDWVRYQRLDADPAE